MANGIWFLVALLSISVASGQIIFEQTCIVKNFQFGRCVQPAKCSSTTTSDSTRRNTCSGKQICCPVNRIISPGSTTTTTPKPSAGNFQQLVEDCGKSTPTTITFPDREIRLRRSPKKLELGKGPDQQPTVVGGRRATVGKWPWIALLGLREARGLRWICGATLVSADTLVTAAHCLVGRSAADLTVRLAEYDLGTSSDGAHQDVSVRQLIVHPDYRAKQNDLALLRLTQPVSFSTRLRPICLTPPGHSFTGQLADLAGWGRLTFAGETADVLQEVQLQVINSRECEDIYRTVNSYDRDFPGGFQGTKLCAAGENGASRDACSGDSGGPLVVRRNGRYQLIGVVSTGVGCGNPDFPGIYTKVNEYTSWIIQNAS